ncbi:MAG: hypothetical protein ACJAZP_003052 [Psychromonas sp.]|jgi:hypothetical protein|uniref:hypothetical protein n=1 Tax=Psychromonas sp. TaxID=1884585 RepID=UPI0039E356C2
MKILTLTVFLLISLSVNAKPLSDQQLKLTGRALANYQLCSDVAEDRNDPAMFHYYNDMYNDSLRAGKLLYIGGVQVIFTEQQKTAIKLDQIDKDSITLLCLSRFDGLSRKMQEQKMAAEKNTTKM